MIFNILFTSQLLLFCFFYSHFHSLWVYMLWLLLHLGKPLMPIPDPVQKCHSFFQFYISHLVYFSWTQPTFERWVYWTKKKRNLFPNPSMTLLLGYFNLYLLQSLYIWQIESEPVSGRCLKYFLNNYEQSYGKDLAQGYNVKFILLTIILNQFYLLASLQLSLH